MAKTGDIYLGVLGSEVLLPPDGRTLRFEEPEEIIREGRVASGKYRGDIKAVKEGIVIEYSLVKSATYAVFKGLYDLHKELSLKIYDTAESYRGYTVKMQPVGNGKRVLIINGGVWSGAVLRLREV